MPGVPAGQDPGPGVAVRAVPLPVGDGPAEGRACPGLAQCPVGRAKRARFGDRGAGRVRLVVDGGWYRGAVPGFRLRTGVPRPGRSALPGSGCARRNRPARSDTGVPRSLLFAGVALALVGVMGVALGSLLRSIAGGIANLIGLLLLGVVVNLLPASIRHDISQCLPGNAASSMFNLHQASGTLSPTGGLAALTAREREVLHDVATGITTPATPRCQRRRRSRTGAATR